MAHGLKTRPLMPNSERSLGGWVLGSIEGRLKERGPLLRKGGSSNCYSTTQGWPSPRLKFLGLPTCATSVPGGSLTKITCQLLENRGQACGRRMEARIKGFGG